MQFTAPDGTAFELPLGQFLERLGVDVADLCPSRHWVVFAGDDGRPLGGTGDIAGTFACEEEAKAYFRRLRASSGYKWAQLVSFDARGRAHTVCWFGDVVRHPTITGATQRPPRRPPAPPELHVVPAEDERWMARTASRRS